jgi:NAD-dependent DNA ligase
MNGLPHYVFSSPNRRILQTSILTYYDKYRNDVPVMEDKIYDLLIEFLELRAPKSKVLKQVGAPVKTKNKAKLDYTLASMDKIKPTDTNKLEKWVNDYKAPYYASDKLDGISALLIYTVDEKIKLFTRGDVLRDKI